MIRCYSSLQLITIGHRFTLSLSLSLSSQLLDKAWPHHCFLAFGKEYLSSIYLVLFLLLRKMFLYQNFCTCWAVVILELDYNEKYSILKWSHVILIKHKMYTNFLYRMICENSCFSLLNHTPSQNHFYLLKYHFNSFCVVIYKSSVIILSFSVLYYLFP